MSCKYIYKGHVFNSELALDDFLIENRRFEPILGDAVFSNSSAKNRTEALLVPLIKQSKDLQEKYKEWERLNKIEHNDDGDEAFEAPPYIGVNKFLSGLTNEKGELLFPEFREDNYWNGRFKKWKEGDFTDNNGELNQSEIDEFGIDPNNPPRITDPRLAEAMKLQMKHRWEVQAKTGTAIHNILQIIFSKSNGRYNFELSDAELEDVINRKIISRNKPFLKDSIIKNTIEYARKLHSDLVKDFGENLSFYPEFAIALDANIIENDSPTTLFGIMDLLIVDGDGRVHILDYKTSVHSYSEFSDAKKSAYNYLLATYQRMLEKAGIDTYESKLMVSPIQIRNFRKDDDTYDYDDIAYSRTYIPIKISTNTRLLDNIDNFMPTPFKVSISAEQAGETTATWMAQCFPKYSSTRLLTEKDVTEMLRRNNKLEPDEHGVFTFRKGNREGTITSNNEIDFVKKVTTYILSLPGRRLKLTGDIKSAVLQAIKNRSIKGIDFPTPSDAKIGDKSDTKWIESTFSKYCDGTWELVNEPVTEAYGILMFKTKDMPGIPNLVDFVRISTNDLRTDYRKNLDENGVFKNRRGLTSRFESDVTAFSKNNSLMAEAVNGNVELMETTALINQLTGLHNCVVGNVTIANPVYADGLSMSNELLLYCFNELTKHAELPNNKIMSGEIKFAKKYELVIQQLNRIVKAGNELDWKDEYRFLKGFKSCVPNYDTVILGDTDVQLRKLRELRREIEADDYLRRKTSGRYERLSDLLSMPVSLYNSILIAEAQLKGINFRQLLRDHDKWLESIMIWRHGVSGSYLDNPGNLSSETLNLITKLVTEAYQNTRDEILLKKIKVSKLVEDLKKEANFGTIKEYTFGNLVDLYKDMYEMKSGNFLFKNPNRLEGAKRRFLEYALEEINKKRYPNEWEHYRDTNDERYYEVPLALGGSDSIVSTLGLMSLLRAKLSYFIPKVAFERALKKVLGVYEKLYETEEDTENKTLLLYKMSNMFDAGQGTDRIEKIKEEGILNLEHNLETLLLKHMFAYSVQENMDTVFPMIKAAMVHLTSEGAMRNKPFSDDILYFEDYIKNKILNKSIVSEKNIKWVRVANLIKEAASKLTLAFAPVLLFYQPLQGLWQNISLMIRKPDGKDSFTFKHFVKATKIVYGDLFHFSKKPTLCSLLNELYGMNDMDMNTYIDRISSAKKGFWNFENLLFKFASRPDYYNRMVIFVCLMMGDGCLEAHSVTEDGRLVYNWKLDDRYKAFANNDKSDMEAYNKARAMYYAAAKLFVNEHTKNADGTMFEINMDNPMDLPRAYTNKEAESMKSLADDIYGYYSHEKKSLIMATAIGSLWLQFKTYWSGKKNQYLAAGGSKLRGLWKHYEENGLKYYYQVDGNGNILYNEPPTTTKTIAPVYLWEGQWLEGIILTLSDMFKEMWDKKSIIKGFKSKWNEEDIKLRNAYRSNIKLLIFDITMFSLIGCLLGGLLGDWLEELKEGNKKNRDLLVGLGITSAYIGVLAVKNSAIDLNFADSIGAPVINWTPFAFEWGGRMAMNWWNVIMGDEDFWDGVVKSSGGLKLIKPVLDSIKPDVFRTEREGGTFNKEE